MFTRIRKFWKRSAVFGCLAFSLAARGNEPGRETVNPQALRGAILDLQNNPEYPREFLQRWEKISSDPNATCDQWKQLQREALLANPLLCRSPLLFVVRQQYQPDHHNTETMFQTGEINAKKYTGGGALKVINFAEKGAVRVLVDAGPEGVVRDPEVHFDGKRILFSMRRNSGEDYHIYEVNADGSGLRQLTHSQGVFDIDPIYLADDHIAFSSSREPKYCMCNRHIMGNLYRMEPDGANITQIGKNTLFEGHCALLPDGRILYDRWEYVDRNFGDGQGLWTMNPDGTSPALWFKNNTGSPGAVLEGRMIPGTQQVVCTFSSCHDRPWGAIAIVDRTLGLEGRAPVVRTWPADAVNLVDENGSFDAFRKVLPKYEDPFPLNTKYFLCSRMIGNGEAMGIYLLDVFGNELLLHYEDPGCYDPIPLAAHPRPAVLPTRRDWVSKEGTFLVQDVYQGTHMQGVKRGEVKFLRVVEQGEKRSFSPAAWGGQGSEAPAMNWHDFSNKRILGTVPVEEDGSAYFSVPAGRFVLFQLLDAKGMLVQSMRSATVIQPGETQGCIGCHEDRLKAPNSLRKPSLMALRRQPSTLNGWQGEPRFFNYLSEVQPVWDKACVSCHDYGKEAGKKLLLCGDRGLVFNTSYHELWSKRYVRVIGAGPAPIQAARSWGSAVSPLVQVLAKGHQSVQLSLSDMERILTWIDINAPYYPSYNCAHPQNLYGRAPLDKVQINRLAQLGIDLSLQPAANQVSFDRPELSPCLAQLPEKNGPAYTEALEIIRKGAAELKSSPEADIPNFRACETDLLREKKYQIRQAIEEKNRAAVAAGKKVYDKDPVPQ